VGEGARIPLVSRDIDAAFPHLAAERYEITSPATDAYNCIAWAAGVTHPWWWPDPLGAEYWPAQAPRAETLQAFILAYQAVGYEPCA